MGLEMRMGRAGASCATVPAGWLWPLQVPTPAQCWEEHSEQRLAGPVPGGWGWAKMIETSKSQTQTWQPCGLVGTAARTQAQGH